MLKVKGVGEEARAGRSGGGCFFGVEQTPLPIFIIDLMYLI